ncbi:MAG: hypothetical protein AVDCRST_MAG60-1041, partial [uncultured Nocardioides sp.]
ERRDPRRHRSRPPWRDRAGCRARGASAVLCRPAPRGLGRRRPQRHAGSAATARIRRSPGIGGRPARRTPRRGRRVARRGDRPDAVVASPDAGVVRRRAGVAGGAGAGRRRGRADASDDRPHRVHGHRARDLRRPGHAARVRRPHPKLRAGQLADPRRRPPAGRSALPRGAGAARARRRPRFRAGGRCDRGQHPARDDDDPARPQRGALGPPCRSLPRAVPGCGVPRGLRRRGLRRLRGVGAGRPRCLGSRHRSRRGGRLGSRRWAAARVVRDELLRPTPARDPGASGAVAGALVVAVAGRGAHVVGAGVGLRGAGLRVVGGLPGAGRPLLGRHRLDATVLVLGLGQPRRPAGLERTAPRRRPRGRRAAPPRRSQDSRSAGRRRSAHRRHRRPEPDVKGRGGADLAAVRAVADPVAGLAPRWLATLGTGAAGAHCPARRTPALLVVV